MFRFCPWLHFSKNFPSFPGHVSISGCRSFHNLEFQLVYQMSQWDWRFRFHVFQVIRLMPRCRLEDQEQFNPRFLCMMFPPTGPSAGFGSRESFVYLCENPPCMASCCHWDSMADDPYIILLSSVIKTGCHPCPRGSITIHSWQYQHMWRSGFECTSYNDNQPQCLLRDGQG